MTRIREADPARDRPALRRLVVALQETERALDPRMPAGEAMADAYLGWMAERCAEHAGVVLVAEVSDRVVGFACVWTHLAPDDPDEDPTPYALVSELAVDEDQRGRGTGRALLHAACDRARAAGAPWIRLEVKAGNEPALGLYRREGFRELQSLLEKKLD